MLDNDDLKSKPKLIDMSIIISDNEKMNRIEICRKCEMYNSMKFCTKCNCYMPLKTWLSFSKCPLNKW